MIIVIFFVRIKKESVKAIGTFKISAGKVRYMPSSFGEGHMIYQSRHVSRGSSRQIYVELSLLILFLLRRLSKYGTPHRRAGMTSSTCSKAVSA